MGWPADSLIEVRVHYVVNLQKCMNVFHYTNEGNSLTFDIPVLTESFATANANVGNGSWAQEFANQMGSSCTVTGVSVQLVYPQRWRAFEIITNIDGTRVGGVSAQNVQASLTKLGLLANRHNQGGMRIGGLSELDYAFGVVTNDFKTSLDAFALDMAADRSDLLTTSVYIPTIANKVPIPGTDPVKFRFDGGSIIATWVVERELRTQRTRTVGRGE